MEVPAANAVPGAEQALATRTESGAALAVRARSGDREAFDHLYRLTVREVEAWLAYRCYHWDMIEECLQRTYITAFQALDRFDPSGPVLPWLKGVARNVVLQYLERSRRGGHGTERVIADVQRRCQATDDLDQELGPRLEHCLERLGERTRALIWQRYVEEQPVERIADSQQRTANAVSVALLRARQALRRCIGAGQP